MLITTQNEIVSLMPTARWDRPEQLLGYLEEEERVTLEPLLGTTLYEQLCEGYVQLREKFKDITSTTVRPTKKAKESPSLPYADVTTRLEQIQNGSYGSPYSASSDGETDVSDLEMAVIRLVRICQQIEFYKMLSHKAGLLTVSFNEGGGMNTVSAEGYEPADDKRMERVVKDAFMSAGRAVDSLLLFLEADAKKDRYFTDLWKQADSYYLHKDLLFQTARVLNEYLDINGERLAYVKLIRDIRFCQNTYIKTRIGLPLLTAVLQYANEDIVPESQLVDDFSSIDIDPGSIRPPLDGIIQKGNKEQAEPEQQETVKSDVQAQIYAELLSLLRTALAFYVESRRTALEPVRDKLARRDSMTDAQQALAAACDYIAENLDALGEPVKSSPIYKAVKEAEQQAAIEAANVQAAEERRRAETFCQNSRKLFTAFPATHRNPEYK